MNQLDEEEEWMDAESKDWILNVYGKSLRVIAEAVREVIPAMSGDDAMKFAGAVVARLTNAGITVEKAENLV
jgi:hypothetical protein